MVLTESQEKLVQEIAAMITSYSNSSKFNRLEEDMFTIYMHDPCGVSSSPTNLFVVKNDGFVTVWEHDPGNQEGREELITSEPTGDAEYPSLEDLRDTVWSTVNERPEALVLAVEPNLTIEVILLMRSQGWEDARGGGVWHGNNHKLLFPSYFAALESCIEVGTRDLMP